MIALRLKDQYLIYHCLTPRLWCHKSTFFALHQNCQKVQNMSYRENMLWSYFTPACVHLGSGFILHSCLVCNWIEFLKTNSLKIIQQCCMGISVEFFCTNNIISTLYPFTFNYKMKVLCNTSSNASKVFH